MKSEHKEKKLIECYVKIVLKPNEVLNNISLEKQDILDSLVIVAISAVLFLLGIFIAGGAIYNMFYEQYSTFILEKITSSSLYGFTLSRSDFVLVFISGFIFVVKSWIFFSVAFYAVTRAFGEKQNIKRALNLFSWSIYPYAWVMFLLGVVCFVLNFVIPLYSLYVYIFGLGAIFIIFIPLTLQRFYENQKGSLYKIVFAYYLVLFVVLLLWTVNHYSMFPGGGFV